MSTPWNDIEPWEQAPWDRVPEFDDSADWDHSGWEDELDYDEPAPWEDWSHGSTDTQRTMTDEPTTREAKYEKIEKIAEHGQGTVWKVQEKTNGTILAQKWLLETQQNDQTLKRFHREVRTQSALKHPGIMPILEFSFSSSPPWYVMPLAQESLADTLRKNGRLSESNTVLVISQVISGLKFAHNEGVIHRDIKPDNILFINGKWVVSDFGLCRDYTAETSTMTVDGVQYGTLPYMAPEQFSSAHTVTAAADIYSLGKVLYQCLTGRLPFPQMDDELIPDSFKYIVTKSTSFKVEDRHTSLESLESDITALAEPTTLTRPIDYAQELHRQATSDDLEAVPKLLKFILKNLSDEVFIRGFLPQIQPKVLAALQAHSEEGFRQAVRAFDRAASGQQPFSWTDTAALFLQRVFEITTNQNIKDIALKRILVLGTEQNRFAVRDIYISIISELTSPNDVLMAAQQLSAYPRGAGFVRDYPKQVSFPERIQDALAA
ncbi:serine/threonine-protein kinase [Corynebacterium sp.]|uniref:serine/threonine-protein kinase n=1 Tax=Corynebacterium sp. TaxID=1720 RepID=UPI003B3B4176